jgi:putative transposase
MPGNRRTVRSPHFNYAASAVYFITLCTENQTPLFGVVIDSTVCLSELGVIVKDEWLKSPLLRPTVHLDEWRVMPEHFHAIVGLGMKPDEIGKEGQGGIVGAHSCAPCHEDKDQMESFQRQPRSLSTLVAQFKATTTRAINERRGTPGEKVWQQNYNDRIIRNAVELDKLRDYIRDNARNYEK